MTLPALLSRWRSEPSIAENIIVWEILPSQVARTVPFPKTIHPALLASVQSRGIPTLYTHQDQAWREITSGQSIVLSTGTASGKSLAYNLPVLDRLLKNPETRALYIFPTKALAQDQSSSLHELVGQFFSLPMAVYDGDTPANARPSIRANARILLSNPDMLHTGILPHHTRWADFFQNLQFVVIDELHIYRGVFGSHVANVIRRLKRIAQFYGSSPQFILTSATIANPIELAQRLVEEPVSLIAENGAPRGPRYFLIYNPPVVDESLGLRRSALLESVRLVEDLLHYNIQTIVFGRSRRSVEILLTYLREHDTVPPRDAPDLKPKTGSSQAGSIQALRGYRSGYLPRQRRAIEQGLRKGEVRAVVATNALELGIDIGGMGACVMAGYPGTIASTWQQAGRAGRGEEPSLAMLVATASPLDQFIAHHPEYFFGRSPENALINPDNLLILLNHLRCAMFELPFKDTEGFGSLPGEQTREFLDYLLQEGIALHSGNKYFWLANKYPAEAVSLRSASPQKVILQANLADGMSTIGEIDQASALWMVHPQAVYLHEAEIYLVEEFNLEQGIAILRPAELDYYTEPQRSTTVQLIAAINQTKVKGGDKGFGDIQVTSQVTGFRKVRWNTHEQLGFGELNLPPNELQTNGYWIALSPETVDHLREQNLWTNDPNDYGPGWTKVKEVVRARDGYRCQLCGTAEQGKAHDVHHKIPFRSFASPEQANQIHNLITLCPSCHHRVEVSLRMRSGLAGLAYTLGQLAPLFLMCDVHDLGSLSEPQSTLADGNPAVILYDQVPAGIGFCQQLFELHSLLVQRAAELINQCECRDGCPSCVGPAGENGSGGKKETLALLNELI
jgi:DEAD/DEAH box helicase domain-containing protein